MRRRNKTTNSVYGRHGTPPSPLLTQEYGYDTYGRLTGITVNNTPEIAYTLDADSRRTAAALGDETTWSYGYDGKGQLLSAEREDENETPLNTMSYAYDEIGNRLTASEDLAAKTYTANDLNQYTAINAEAPTYDPDGNMLTNDGWSYTWNCENRLVAAEKDDTRLEFSYDYMGRRIYKKVYDSNTLIKHEKYVYDGYKLIAVIDGLNNDDLLMTFVWQPIDLDVPVCMTASGSTYYYITDGNKNVTGLVDSTGARVATYLYGPFGQTLSATGTAAALNPFRFSSEFHDDETGLVYYNYRYYSPALGRWTKRDPIGENGGANIYLIGNNDSINKSDIRGAVTVSQIVEIGFILGISDSDVLDMALDFHGSYDEKQLINAHFSDLIIKIQQKLGVTADGDFGPESCIAFERHAASQGWGRNLALRDERPSREILDFVLNAWVSRNGMEKTQKECYAGVGEFLVLLHYESMDISTKNNGRLTYFNAIGGPAGTKNMRTTAVGIAQITFETASEFNISPDDRYDAAKSVNAAINYLFDQNRNYAGDFGKMSNLTKWKAWQEKQADILNKGKRINVILRERGQISRSELDDILGIK